MSLSPKKRNLLSISAVLFALLILTGCELTLAEDILPPDNYQRVSLERPSAEAVFVAPQKSPDLTSGAAIFAQSCAPCHGETGMGGGSMAENLPKQPPDIGSPEVAGQASPVDWFAMVTLGKIDALMPPFEDELTVQQRWDVLAYVYSLSDSGDMLTSILPEGLEIVDQLPQTEEPSEVSEQPQVTETAPPTEDPQAEAATEVGTDQPDTSETPVTETAQPDDAAPDNGDQAGETQLGRIFGTITHGAGLDVPEDLEVTLLAFDGFEQSFELTTAVKEDGTYTFDDLEMTADRVFLTTVTYQGMNYGSHFNFIPEGETELELPVTIFETTTDLSSLVISGLAVRMEFINEDFARIHFFYQVVNPTQLSVIPAHEGAALFTYRLPVESHNPQLEQEFMGDYFVDTIDGFGDTRSILAESEEYTLAFSYEVPYSDEYTIEIPLQVPVETLFVFLPSDGPELEGANFKDDGETTVAGLLHRVLTRSDIPAGELSLTVKGRNPSAPPTILGTALDLQILVSLSLLSISLVIVAFWYFRSRPAAAASTGQTPEALMDEIISLDIDFENGQITDSQYHSRREELKARLAELLDRS